MSTKPHTTYGSLPISSPEHFAVHRLPLPPTYITRAGFPAQTIIGKRRPWRELLEISSLSRPDNYTDAMERIRKNLSYFRVNYAMVILIILFISLVYHPMSMIVFLIIFIAWFFLYLSRDYPIVLFNRTLDDRITLLILSLLTIVGLVFTHVGFNVLVSLIIGVFVVGLHGACRGIENLFMDESEATEGGLLSVVSSEEVRAPYRFD